MLIYANTLHFKSDADLEMALLILEKTISQLSGEDISLGEDLPSYPNRRYFNNGSRYVFSKYMSDKDAFFSLKYSRKDESLFNRLWHTTISFCRETAIEYPIKNTTDCKITVETEDLKPTDTPPIIYTPPIVGKFMKHLPLSDMTPSPTVTTLDYGDTLYQLNKKIDSVDRRYALAIICPDENDNFPIQSARLAYLTAGLADVYEIDIDADWGHVANVLGWRFTPRSGEVKIIYPVNQTNGFMIPQWDFKPFKIALLKEEGQDIEQEIFTQIAFRVCKIHAYNKQTTPESIAKMIKHQRFQQIKQHALQTAEEHVSNEFKELFDHTDKELEHLRDETKQLKAENRRLKYELQNLKDSFQTTAVVAAATDFNFVELKKILDIGCERFFVEDSLRIIQTTFPERLVVLDSAVDSAVESRVFRDKKRVFNLLWKLATDYYQLLCEGKPDAQSRQVFGDDFSAKESETVERHPTARQLRTFNYKGTDYEMMAHLRIGIKDSIADTLRIHFRWFADEQKIVIGHCGKHLWKLG